MYKYLASVMEPWDGPAALAMTDGRWAVAGDRPQRAASAALHADRRRAADRRFRKRHGRGARDDDRRQGPARPRPDDRGRSRRRASCSTTARSRTASPARHDYAAMIGEFVTHRRSAGAQGRPRHALRPRRADPPPGRGRADARGHGADPVADGRDRQGSDRIDGRRHAARGDLGQAAADQPVLPPEFQPGHQPADRQLARTPRDVAQDALRQPRQHPRHRGTRRTACWCSKARC